MVTGVYVSTLLPPVTCLVFYREQGSAFPYELVDFNRIVLTQALFAFFPTEDDTENCHNCRDLNPELLHTSKYDNSYRNSVTIKSLY